MKPKINNISKFNRVHNQKPNTFANYMVVVTIIIPVKDEEDGLRFLLDDYKKSSLKDRYEIKFIFVIDCRTSDSSKKYALEFSNNIIDQKETTGKGAAVSQAVTLWKKEPTEIAIFLDADGSYSFDSVLKLILELESGSDIVSGSRFLSNGSRPDGMSRLHFFGNRFLSLTSSIRNRRRIRDLCTGLWGFRREALMKLDLKSSGFDLEAEISGLSRKKSLHHKEVEVEWSQRKGGISKLKSISDGLIIFFRIIRT